MEWGKTYPAKTPVKTAQPDAEAAEGRWKAENVMAVIIIVSLFIVVIIMAATGHHGDRNDEKPAAQQRMKMMLIPGPKGDIHPLYIFGSTPVIPTNIFGSTLK